MPALGSGRPDRRERRLVIEEPIPNSADGKVIDVARVFPFFTLRSGRQPLWRAQAPWYPVAVAVSGCASQSLADKRERARGRGLLRIVDHRFVVRWAFQILRSRREC